MEIKLSLKQLTALFAQAAGNQELPRPIQQFAAQLTVLTAHLDAESRARKLLETTLDNQIAELATFIMARPAAETAAATPSPSAPIDSAPIVVASEMDEEDEAKAMAEKVMQETEAEVAALAAAPPEVVVRKNGGKKAPAASAS